MWVVVLFDIPEQVAPEYRLFRRYLLRRGFEPVQKSVYLRWVDSSDAAGFCAKRLVAEFSSLGKAVIFCLTEKAMRNAYFIEDGRRIDSPPPPEPFLLY